MLRMRWCRRAGQVALVNLWLVQRLLQERFVSLSAARQFLSEVLIDDINCSGETVLMSTVLVVVISRSPCKFLVALRHGFVKLRSYPRDRPVALS